MGKWVNGHPYADKLYTNESDAVRHMMSMQKMGYKVKITKRKLTASEAKKYPSNIRRIYTIHRWVK